MSFAGAFETYNPNQTELNDGSIFRIRDIDAQLYWKNRNSAEFYKLMLAVSGGRTLTQPKWEFGKTDKSSPFVVVKLAATSGATSIDVYDAYNCVAGDVLHNPRTGEQLRVSAVTDSDTLAFASSTGYGRGFAGSTAAAVVVGDYLFKIGRVIAHSGVAPAANNVMPTHAFNYAEMWVKTIHVNKVQEQCSMLDGVGKRDETYMRKLWEMDEEVNYAMYFGRRMLAYEAEGALYTMDGIDQQIRTHVRSGSGIAFPTWEIFNEWFSPTFDANSSSDTKALFSGQNLFGCFLAAARAVGVAPSEYLTKLGSTVTTIQVDGGTVELVKDYKSLCGPLAGDGFLIDSANVEYRPFGNFGRAVVTDVQARNEILIAKDTIIQSGSVALFHEESHMRLRDFSGPFGSTRL